MTARDVAARLDEARAHRAALERLRGHPSVHGTEAARRLASAEVDRLAAELGRLTVGDRR